MTAEYKVHGSVAVITLANPPVNGLGLSTRQGIVDGLDKAQQDAAVKAIVITGAGGAFSGGADIKEFGTDKAMQEPNLNSVIAPLKMPASPWWRPSTAWPWAAAWNWPWAAITAWRHRVAALRCPRSSWASCPARAARSVCPASLAWKRP
jgi:hypothetical protein